MSIRIASWNVNSLKARLALLESWLKEIEPDVVCLQETKSTDAAFPFGELAELGYEAAHHGDGRWNGVAILSRCGLEDVRRGFTGDESDEAAERRLISATCAGVRVHSVYVPNGRVVGSEHYQAKLEFLAKLGDELALAAGERPDVAIAGDFNVAPSDLDVFDPAFFEGATHVTPDERRLVEMMLANGFVDVLRAAYPGVGGIFSWWDYRSGDFHKGRGMRIDLLLASKHLADQAEFALIDRNARKGQFSKSQPQPSDHAPLVASFAISRS